MRFSLFENIPKNSMPEKTRDMRKTMPRRPDVPHPLKQMRSCHRKIKESW